MSIEIPSGDGKSNHCQRDDFHSEAPAIAIITFKREGVYHEISNPIIIMKYPILGKLG